MAENWFKYFVPNKYLKYFTTDRIHQDVIDKQKNNNAQGLSQEQIDIGRTFDDQLNAYNNIGMSTINIQFEQYFTNKAGKIAKYREMSYYPIISDALDIISDEAIVESVDGRLLELEIKEDFPEHVNDEIKNIWAYLINDVFNYNDTAWELFRRLLVDGELYCELVLNSSGDDVIAVKFLPPHTMTPIYDGGVIVGFLQSLMPSGFIDVSMTVNSVGGFNSQNSRMFDKEQIIHIKFADGQTVYDSKGFLEASVRLYNQLKVLEDAVVVYRITRAPERRIWNIYNGRMNPGKATEQLKQTQQNLRKNVKYDPHTGAMDSSQNFMAMVEDIWFLRYEDGIGSTVETLPGGQNLGEVGDLQYFQKLLYKTLKLPSSRWSDSEQQVFNSGKSGEITREEIKFAQFVGRIQKKFKRLLVDALTTTLKLRKIGDQYVSDYYYNVKFSETNMYKQYKQLEILTDKFSLLGSVDPFVRKPVDNPNGFLSLEYTLRYLFMMSDDEYEMNKRFLEKEKLLETQINSTPENTDNLIGSGGDSTANSEFGGSLDNTSPEDFGEAPNEETPSTESPSTESPSTESPSIEPKEYLNYKGSPILEQASFMRYIDNL